MSTINERVREVVFWLIGEGVARSQRDLAERMGYQVSSFSQIVNGHVPVSSKFLFMLCSQNPRIRRSWIESGMGDMLEPEIRDGVIRIETGTLDDSELITETSHGCKFYRHDGEMYMKVPHVPYAAFGQFANLSDRLDPTTEDWSEEIYKVDKVGRGRYLSFEVKGDSMDTGSRDSFEAGDRVLCRELEREFWQHPIRFKDYPFWVVVFDSSVLIKQMIHQDMEHALLTFHSLNPSPEYADFTLSENDIRALYYVIKKKPKEVDYINF